ncbi:hypothetical protein [Novosphingobium sp. RL4]|uniref:hypothetical protein n=1 Tax=Novosphingobium sp. RL4 TaxID=3109595 RepID=UPI002D77E689|nr:hypothetical protein [Novosphingobium sp. RL4]WRT91337.1 hypothetical protein U9J33_08835 [Novosphingobium sp. RL4]
MTDIDTDKLRALDEVATSGPWETDHEADEITRSHDYFVGAEVGGKWRTLMDTVNSDHKLIEDDRDGEGGMAWDVIGMANAELVAHLRNLVPAILAMAEENKRLREALEPFAECCDQIADTEDDGEWAKFRLLVRNYRTARRALGKEPEA